MPVADVCFDFLFLRCVRYDAVSFRRRRCRRHCYAAFSHDAYARQSAFSYVAFIRDVITLICYARFAAAAIWLQS